jgi:hypothetical protein
MRASTKLNGTPFEMTEGTATFLSGGFASFTFWVAAIPADNVKKYVCFPILRSLWLLMGLSPSLPLLSPISAAYSEPHWILLPPFVMLSERYISPPVGGGISRD